MKVHIPTAHPEMWKYFEEQARNIESSDLEHKGKYRIPKPDKSGNFIYADNPKSLMLKLREDWYNPSFESPSVRGKIQAIVQTFK